MEFARRKSCVVESNRAQASIETRISKLLQRKNLNEKVFGFGHAVPDLAAKSWGVPCASTPTSTVAAGASATYTLDLAGSNGYAGTIAFACSNLPTGAACTFNPASVIAIGNTPLSTVMTISTMARSAAAASLRRGPTPGSTTLLASLGGIGLLGLLLAGSGPKARRRRAGIAFGVLLLMTLGTMVACDNENSTVKTGTGTPAGAYAVTVTSTGTGTNAPTHSLNVTLVVQ